MAKKKPGASTTKGPTPVEAVKHTDRRPNIPTREQGAMVAEEEAAPKTQLYPRDPSLDPQLVWKGKDEQDRTPLEIPIVPIYIQEKIHPLSIIEGLRDQLGSQTSDQPDLYADFNGLEADPSKRTSFYQFDRHWTNRLILGDSLYVMNSLAEKERLKGRVQMIYFDPPYGIKYGSNWQVSTRKRDVKDAKAEDTTRQPEQIKAFRDTWQYGIHSYLTVLRDRLTVARELLTESGSLFVQIGDENVHLVRSLMDEVIGSENFVAHITFAKTSGSTREYLGGTCDYVLFYAKHREQLKYRQPYNAKTVESEIGGPYSLLELKNGTRRRTNAEERSNPRLIEAGARVYRLDNLQSQSIGREKGEGAACWFPVKLDGKDWLPGAQSRWKTNERGMANLKNANRLQATANGLYYVRYIDDFPAMPLGDNWTDTVVAGFASEKQYVVETSTKVIERCLLMTTDPGDLVLDPTCGSGTTAYVAEQWGRRWITIDTSRVALALARTRLMAKPFPYYLLADSPEGRKKEADILGLFPQDGPTARDMHKGFVYKRVPHVTLKSIATNPDIKEGMTREQIDAAILKHAETELLFDQPYEDKDIVRVAGPFTVESLSPHRVLPAGEAAAPTTASDTTTVADFATMILDNLRKAGVQNTKRNERLDFERLDLYAGEYLQAEGTYSENGKTKRVAVCIGPEFGTVGQELLASAAQEAHRGMPFDLLLVCGFAFDPHVSEEGKVIEKQIGRVKVLLVRMNPDLSMGDDLLKKTGAGNLFMVFGEPDIAIEKQPDGKFVVEVRGVDVFDPTTSEIRSSGPEDIACWFIDTEYNGESFFVRHAYFLGGQEPYEKLKRALRADIDEAQWSRLYSARSLPFTPPKKGKIAVKVINHYGDEVLKVYPVGKI